MSRKVRTSPAGRFLAFCTQPAAKKMRHTISIHGSARFIALLALLLVDATHSANAQTMSNAATMKILWSDIRQFGGITAQIPDGFAHDCFGLGGQAVV